MMAWECAFAGQADNAHEHCTGERRVGNLATAEVSIYQCSCACHGEGRDGRYLRTEWDGVEGKPAE